MKAILLVLLTIALSSVARADSDGSGILPFGSAGGLVSGVAEVHPDGTFDVTGEMASGVTFIGHGSIWIGADGVRHFECALYVDGDLLRKKGGAFPTRLNLKDDGDGDFTDGNPVDDNVGEVELAGSNAGKGSTPIYG